MATPSIPTISTARALAALLRSLRRGGDDAKLHRSLLDLESAIGVSDETALAEIRASSSEIRDGLGARRWRETQLESMLDTAQELMSSSATDALLGVVIHATRRLVPCDIAHINLGVRDQEFMQRLRASEGEVTHEWRTYHNREGVGVTGRVFELNAPFVAYDYVTEPEMVHGKEADEAARSDGVHTMAGVPLRRGTEVVGALIASWRTNQRITAVQLSAMSSLASLASVALESSRIQAERRVALDELEVANVQLLEVNKTLEWGSRFHDDLTRLILSSADIGQVNNRVAETLACDAAILDGDGLTVASTSPGFPDWPEDTGPPTEPGAATTSSGGVWLAIARSNDIPLATVVVDRVELSGIETQTLERVAVASALLLSNKRVMFETRARSDASAVAELVADGDIPERTLAHARSLGLRSEAHCVVLVVEHPGTSEQLLNAAHTFAQAQGGLAGHPEGRTTLIVPGSDPADVAQRVRQQLEPRLGPVSIGAHGPIDDLRNLPAAFSSARSCCAAVQRLRLPERFATPASLGFAGLLVAEPTAEQVKDFVERTIGPLVDYDNTRGSDLVRTLETFFSNYGSLQKTASDLHVHTNTIYQRQRRIAALLGEEWQSGDQTLELQMALRLHRLAAPVTTRNLGV